MAQVASVDWETKRVFLHLDTVTNGFDAWEAHAEIRNLQALNLNSEQNYRLPTRREGGLVKTAGRLTPRFVGFLTGWRVVPYDTPHQLRILVEMISDDQVVDRDMFDRSTVTSNVDIDTDYEQVEIIEVATGAGPTAPEVADAVWQRVVEGTLTAEEATRLILAFVAGNGTVPTEGIFEFRDLANSKSRIAGTVDSSGDRIVTGVDGS